MSIEKPVESRAVTPSLTPSRIIPQSEWDDLCAVWIESHATCCVRCGMWDGGCICGWVQDRFERMVAQLMAKHG